MLIIIGALGYRVYDLAAPKRPLLMRHAVHESVHKHILPANRGTIYDRNGVALAVSSPVDNIVLDPKKFTKDPADWAKLTNIKALNLSMAQLSNILKTQPNSRFYYLAKGVSPSIANQITDLRLDGVYAELKQKSFYPLGESMAQLVGFTDNDNNGADGLELGLNNQLEGKPGLAWVTEDAKGHVLKVRSIIKKPVHGHDVTLSIDSRIQAIAYIALKNQMRLSKAKSASIVVMNPHTGEVLASVSYPSFNPNDPSKRVGPAVRARAITDQFEPASTMKVLTIASGLQSGKYTPDTPVDASPGFYYVGHHRIRDDGDFGMLTVTSVLTKSSNVGASKIALSIPHELFYNKLVKAGFGTAPTFTFPGATPGILHPLEHMGDFEYATMSFGYALASSLLQMGKVYSAIANHGVMLPATFIKTNHPPMGTVLMSPTIAKQLIAMLATVVTAKGTGILANIPGYEVVGKTGTSHQVGPHGFYKHHYNAIFIGLAPADDPQLMIAVRFNDPKGRVYSFGGISAAPVFAKVMEAALQLRGVVPSKSRVNLKLFKNQHKYYEWVIKA